jgi:hypothetical protein
MPHIALISEEKTIWVLKLGLMDNLWKDAAIAQSLIAPASCMKNWIKSAPSESRVMSLGF